VELEMKRMTLFLLCGFLLCAGGVSAQNINRVLLVINDNSPNSIEVGNYYALKRGVPTTNICHIFTQNSATTVRSSERIDWSTFVSQIRNPILNHIAANNLTIEYIVLTRGIPPVVEGGAGNPTNVVSGQGIASTDSLLAVSRDYPAENDLNFTNEDETIIYTRTWVNRFWNSPTPFSRASNSGYIVTRLEGWTPEEIKAMIDRSVEAAYLVGTWVFDLSPEYGFYLSRVHPWGILDEDYVGLRYLDFNYDIYQSANETLAARIPGVLRVDGDVVPSSANGTFANNIGNIAGYIGWGSNDAARDEFGAYLSTRARWNTLGFLPGSIGDIAYSSSGYTFNNRNALNRTLIADLVAQGISGARGNIAEPYLDGISSPTVLFRHYLNGFNLGEAFYSAGRFIGWREVVIGDPLTKVKVPRLIPLTEQVSSGKQTTPIGISQ